MLPSLRLILLVLAASPLFLAGTLIEGFSAIGVVYVIILGVYTSLDWLLLPKRKHVRITRKVPDRISLNVSTTIEVQIENLSRRTVDVSICENINSDLKAEPLHCVIRLKAGRTGTVKYRITSAKRGVQTVDSMFVRMLPSLGLLYRQFRLNEPMKLEVFPNLVNIARYDLLARRGLTLQAGMARLRRIGQGSEFESLRNYVIGDEISRIDWKATAKRNALIVRNYEPERQQNVFVAIDAGRSTSGEFAGISRLDYLVNATLMLAFVALRQKDQFSLIAFSNKIETYLPPVSGLKNIDRVAQSLFDLKGKMLESDYSAACRFISRYNRKRSLLCLLTDVTGIETNSIVIAHMTRFARQHLPLAITLKNPEIEQLADQPLSTCSDLYSKAVAIDTIAARKEALQLMRRKGVGILDVSPDKLTPHLIKRYLDIKFKNQL